MKKITFLILMACVGCSFGLNAQNVGIGTNTPQFKLSVHDATHGYIKFSNNTTTDANTTGSYIGAFQNDLYFSNKQTNGNQFFHTDGFRRMTIDSVGRVGIGKWPADQLDIKGDLRLESTNNTTGSIIRMYGGATGLSNIYFYKDISSPTLGASIGYNPGSDYAYIANGTSAYFTPIGLGVGTAGPVSKFHVFSGQDVGLGGASNGFMMLGNSTGANLIADNNEIMVRNNGAASDMFLQHDAGNLIICGNEQGAVGIGVQSGATLPAGYLLAVDGKIISEELKVQLSGNWPDYVFQDNYNLKSFDHLRSYIKENKHLPNIPAAAEVEKNGIEVGDMQKRMVEKIEELTLYILELEQRLKALETSSDKKTNTK